MSSPQKRGLAVREKLLDTADELFYREGIRAVGVDTIVEKSGVAKTSLYRWFPTKDDLVAAFLDRRDALFWEQWDKIAERHPEDAAAELLAQLRWISHYVAGPKYRGCPFQIAATEFPDLGHSSREICIRNKQELRQRMLNLLRRIEVEDPHTVADQLMTFKGSFNDRLSFSIKGSLVNPGTKKPFAPAAP